MKKLAEELNRQFSKDIQRYVKSCSTSQLSGKCKPQWDITSHLLGCLLSKIQEINAGKKGEEREPLCATGGNVNWYSHYGGQFGGSSKN